jgi:hypothetical protein
MPVENLDNVLAGIDNAERQILGQIVAGMDYGLRDTVNHIKRGYDRPRTGKGFTDRTGNLRNSLDKKVVPDRHGAEGYVYAGMDYAPHVEERWEGRYAYLWPGVQDKKGDILDAVQKAIRAFTT